MMNNLTRYIDILIDYSVPCKIATNVPIDFSVNRNIFKMD